MHSFKLIIQYDGTNYFGWQRQKELVTVQGSIENVLYRIYKEQVNLIGAGRTDSGVHALFQVAHFRVSKYLSPNIILKALNSLLPKDIRVIKCEEVDSSFHARFSAKQREYKYVIYNAEVCPPFIRNYSFFVRKEINFAQLNDILLCFCGEHDFTSFSVASDPNRNKLRCIYDISASQADCKIVIKIKANSFLRKMVRMIVGTSLALYFKSDISPSYEIKRLFALKDRKLNKYPTAPPQGLFLNKIWY